MGISLWQYFCNRAERISETALADVHTADDWAKRAPGLRRDYFHNMGLDPLPQRCDLRITEHGGFAGPGYRARKISYQLLPDCWAGANYFVPDPLPQGQLPAILYPCGHGPSGVDGYQGDALYWVRRGYACLIFDTIEQNDNTGEHHGLFLGRHPEWLSMGYSAAGGELWNSLRALDALCTMPEVDAKRIGVTGISGGGIMSLNTAIADERIAAAVIVCGVGTPRYVLQNRFLLNHCDCVYAPNSRGRDTADFAALIAPRPLLFCYAEQDALFGPEEYTGLFERTRKVYRLLGCESKCELLTAPGPHSYRPAHLLRSQQWMDQHVAGQAHPMVEPFKREHDEATTTVFGERPHVPNRTDLLPQLMATPGIPPLPHNRDEWAALREDYVSKLRHQVLEPAPHLPATATMHPVREAITGGRGYRKYRGEIDSVDVWIEVLMPPEGFGGASGLPVVMLVDEATPLGRGIPRMGLSIAEPPVMCGIEPRVAGVNAPSKELGTAMMRAAMVAGVTTVSMMIEDLRLLLPRVRPVLKDDATPVILYGRGDAAAACLYHALTDPMVAGLVLEDLPASHRFGAPLIGVMRLLDLPHALGLMAPRPVALVNGGHSVESWATRVYNRLGEGSRLTIAPTLTAAFAAVAKATNRT